MEEGKIKETIKKGYAEVAKNKRSCCPPANSCCSGTDIAEDISKKIGYTEEDLETTPRDSNLGLGCGNPVATASLKEGETVLDLGSGAGFDCFLAANKVGKSGKVVGVDMTEEMIKRARNNAKKGGYQNVEFRLGDIENIPVADNSTDVVISNCVINLAPDKNKVFKETFRILRNGGRLMVSDIVLLKDLPDSVKNSIEAYIGCLSGAIRKDNYINAIKKAGFKNVEIIGETSFPAEFIPNDPTVKKIIKNLDIPEEEIRKFADSVISIKVKAEK